MRYWRGQAVLSLLLAAVVLICFVLKFTDISRFFLGYRPKNVALIQADDLKYRLSTTPALVYFYHKLTDSTPRRYLPVLDEYAMKYGDRLDFYRYELSDYSTEEYKSYWSNESQLVLFEKGKAMASMPGILSNEPIVTRGFIFKLMKPWIAPAGLAVSTQRSDWFVTSANFNSLVLGAARPVVVDFTCQTCPAARMLEPHFKKIALENAGLADFYLVDIDKPENQELIRKYRVRSRPTMVLFYNGKSSLRVSGALTELIGNEALVLGLVSYNYY